MFISLSRGVEVRRLLGEPPDYSARSWKSEIWKYDSLQVTFIKDSLFLIGLYFSNGVLTLLKTVLQQIHSLLRTLR